MPTGSAKNARGVVIFELKRPYFTRNFAAKRGVGMKVYDPIN
jgi:hypothetical protein